MQLLYNVVLVSVVQLHDIAYTHTHTHTHTYIPSYLSLSPTPLTHLAHLGHHREPS